MQCLNCNFVVSIGSLPRDEFAVGPSDYSKKLSGSALEKVQWHVKSETELPAFLKVLNSLFLSGNYWHERMPPGNIYLISRKRLLPSFF